MIFIYYLLNVKFPSGDSILMTNYIFYVKIVTLILNCRYICFTLYRIQYANPVCHFPLITAHKVGVLND